MVGPPSDVMSGGGFFILENRIMDKTMRLVFVLLAMLTITAIIFTVYAVFHKFS